MPSASSLRKRTLPLLAAVVAAVLLSVFTGQAAATQDTPANYGTAPLYSLSGATGWINSKPLREKDLKGKVVLIDFWTYSCINCIRTLPYVVSWYEKYKERGFVVVGVHSPEFAYEKSTRNVQDAIQRFGIRYPVAQDNGFATWKAYNNQYWPAFYLADSNGQVMRQHFGEGEYAEMEAAIEALLARRPPA